MSERKRGALSNDEREYIKKNCTLVSIEDMAVKLNRTVEPIIRFIEQNSLQMMSDADTNRDHLARMLKSKFYWSELQQQFTADEMRTVESMWVDFYLQFNEDVTASEENDLVELIRTQILINRGMRELKRADESSADLERRMDREMEQEEPSEGIIAALGQRLAEATSVKNVHVKNHDILMKSKEKLARALKMTRDQRKMQSEDSVTNFNMLVRELMDLEKRRQQGFDAEKHKMAADKEMARLSEYHIYEDGKGDQPFLNADTVRNDN